MANNVSGYASVINIVASVTFPVGFPVTQFADDSDPLDFASVKVADTAMGVNGDLINWSRAVALPMVINVIPGSIDDLNLQALANANRVAQGKSAANDTITASVVYPDGTTVVMNNGIITDAPFGKSISSAGRLKTNSYAFSFESKT